MLWSIVTNKGYFYNIFLFCDGIKMSLQYRSLCYKSTIFYHPIPYKKPLPFLNIMLYPEKEEAFSSTRFTTIPFLLLLPTHAAPLSPEQLHHKLLLPVEEVPEPFPCCRHAILRLMGSKDYEVLQD